MLAGKLTVDSRLVLDSRFEILRFSFCLSFLRLARNIFAKDKGFLGVFILSKPPLRLNYKFGRGFDMLNLRIRLVAIFVGENLRWWKMKINTLISWNFPRRPWLFCSEETLSQTVESASSSPSDESESLAAGTVYPDITWVRVSTLLTVMVWGSISISNSENMTVWGIAIALGSGSGSPPSPLQSESSSRGLSFSNMSCDKQCSQYVALVR